MVLLLLWWHTENDEPKDGTTKWKAGGSEGGVQQTENNGPA